MTIVDPIQAGVSGLTDEASIGDAALQVLRTESLALRRLECCIDETFDAVVQAVAAAPSHVIVTGMGKSGHVGRKIAATLASVGTPAFFVHPGEASHGDLGMITTSNVVIAISNSGETAELSDVVVYTRRFDIPLIAITSGPDSTLRRQADWALVLPPVEEACPLGLAPTTSTTMTLALGDALAVALLRQKGFTRSDYRDIHPGGRLGNVLQRVQDIMHPPERMPVVAKGTPVTDVLIKMSAGGFGCVGVFDDGDALIGIVTDGDLRRNMSPRLLEQRVDDIMTPSPRVVSREALAAEALKMMTESGITALFVVDDRDSMRPCGFLHVHDCLRHGVY